MKNAESGEELEKVVNSWEKVGKSGEKKRKVVKISENWLKVGKSWEKWLIVGKCGKKLDLNFGDIIMASLPLFLNIPKIIPWFYYIGLYIYMAK